MHDCTIYNVILVGDNIIAKQTASSRLKFIHDTSVIDINTVTEERCPQNYLNHLQHVV